MHLTATPELIGQRHATLLRDAERQRLSAAVRPPRTVTGLLRRAARPRAGTIPG